MGCIENLKLGWASSAYKWIPKKGTEMIRNAIAIYDQYHGFTLGFLKKGTDML